MKYRSTGDMTPHLQVQDCFFRILTLLIWQFPSGGHGVADRATRHALKHLKIVSFHSFVDPWSHLPTIRV